MTKVNSQSNHSVRPCSSTEEGAPGIARPEEPSQPVAASGIAAEVDEVVNEENAARDSKISLRPVRPTKAMVLAHELHHADCRDWCDHCRAGRGVAHQHRTSESDNGEADFSVDYAFMTREGQLELEKHMKDEDKGRSKSSPHWVRPQIQSYLGNGGRHQRSNTISSEVARREDRPGRMPWCQDRVEVRSGRVNGGTQESSGGDETGPDC